MKPISIKLQKSCGNAVPLQSPYAPATSTDNAKTRLVSAANRHDMVEPQDMLQRKRHGLQENRERLSVMLLVHRPATVPCSVLALKLGISLVTTVHEVTLSVLRIPFDLPVILNKTFPRTTW